VDIAKDNTKTAAMQSYLNIDILAFIYSDSLAEFQAEKSPLSVFAI